MKIKHAYIEITNICNLNCRSCYNRSGTPHKKQELSFTQMQTLTDKLVNEYGCERLSLSGGEPTLNSDFSDILDFLVKQDLDTGIVTNGTTGNESLINAFNENDNISVQISLDGSCEEINTRTRGAGNFAKVLSFIGKIKNGKPHLKTVVSQSNIDDVQPFYKLAVSLGCVPVFDFINSMGNAGEVWQSLKLTAKQKLSVLRRVNELNKIYGLNANLPYCTNGCPLVDHDSEHSVLIKADGSVHPCQMLYSDKYVLGNIFTDSAETIEASFHRIADIAKQRVDADYGCEKCLAKGCCRKGCMAAADTIEGSPLANDGECDYRKLQIVGFHAMEQGVPK